MSWREARVTFSNASKEENVTGSPLGDPSAELDKLSAAEKAVLRYGCRFNARLVANAGPDHPAGEAFQALRDLQLRGLARRQPGQGILATARGLVLREAILREAGER